MSKTITVDGIEYVARSEAPPPAPVRIIILQRGWVAVGCFQQDGDDCVLASASIIRTWGTTKGLGEIATGGPTSKTVLDPAGTIRFHQLVIVASLDCTTDKWLDRLR